MEKISAVTDSRYKLCSRLELELDKTDQVLSQRSQARVQTGSASGLGAAVFCSDSNELGACYHTGVQCAAGGLDDGDEFVGGSGFEIETFVAG